MNPFNAIDNQTLNGLEGLAGFSFKKLKKKLKKTIRKVAKVAAPVAALVVVGPAAAASVANAVVKHNKAVKDAKKDAKALGVSWTQYKKLASGEETAQITGNPEAPKIVQKAAQVIKTIKTSPQAQQINQQLANQGYTAQQREQLFYQSRPVQDIVKTATAASVYGGVKQAGYSDAQAAVTAGDAVQASEGLQKILPYAIPAVALLLSA